MKRRRRRIPFPIVIVAFFALAATVGPWVAPSSPETIDLRREYGLPSATHWLGTSDNGVDVLSVLLHGARLGGTIALLVVVASASIGTLLGVWAGVRGGRVDQWLTAVADMIQAFPSVVLYVAILALVARPGLTHVVLALIANGWVLYARLARAQTLTLREREFVTAARAMGASEMRVIVRHIIPNLAGTIVVQATGGFGAAILAESTLSFLGLGPGTGTSWGALLDQGSAVLLRFPHVAIISGAAIAVTVFGFNAAGDRVRDWLDPKRA